jgi:hypothetical protein
LPDAFSRASPVTMGFRVIVTDIGSVGSSKFAQRLHDLLRAPALGEPALD